MALSLLYLLAGRGLELPWDFSPQAFPGIPDGSEHSTLVSGQAAITDFLGWGGHWGLRPGLEGITWLSHHPPFSFSNFMTPTTTQFFSL